MPTLQSRTHEDNIQVVTPEIWKQMQEKGLARRFKIIDNTDIEPEIEVPLEVKNFMEEPKAITFENCTVAELKEMLDEKGIEYPKNAKKQELIDLI